VAPCKNSILITIYRFSLVSLHNSMDCCENSRFPYIWLIWEKNEIKHLAPSWKIRPKLRRFVDVYFFISTFLNFAAKISASFEHCFLPLSSPSAYLLHARPTTRPSPSRAAPGRTITFSLHPMRGWQRTMSHQLQRREFVGVFQKGLLKN